MTDNEAIENLEYIKEMHGAYPNEVEACDRGIEAIKAQSKRGEWKMNSDYPDRLICDKCNAQFDVWHWESKQMHYCPNCGSHNGGEENEQNSACD